VKQVRLVAAAAVVGLVLAATALGATTYAGPRQWWAGQGAGSSFSKWTWNDFAKVSSGYDTTVTFIDNVSYSWHATVRNSSMVTHTAYWGPEVRKGHCRANVGGFWGSCIVG
jgi:hypothetical protein